MAKTLKKTKEFKLSKDQMSTVILVLNHESKLQTLLQEAMQERIVILTDLVKKLGYDPDSVDFKITPELQQAGKIAIVPQGEAVETDVPPGVKAAEKEHTHG